MSGGEERDYARFQSLGMGFNRKLGRWRQQIFPLGGELTFGSRGWC